MTWMFIKNKLGKSATQIEQNLISHPPVGISVPLTLSPFPRFCFCFLLIRIISVFFQISFPLIACLVVTRLWDYKAWGKVWRGREFFQGAVLHAHHKFSVYWINVTSGECIWCWREGYAFSEQWFPEWDGTPRTVSEMIYWRSGRNIPFVCILHLKI